MSVRLFDTTLRDGTQREGVTLTTEDKIRIARELDALGMNYIEAGFPASNPKDLEFFENFDNSELENAKLVAFTRSRRPKGRAGEDPAVTLLASLSAPVACIVSKSWRMQVEKVLSTTPEENRASISDPGSGRCRVSAVKIRSRKSGLSTAARTSALTNVTGLPRPRGSARRTSPPVASKLP